MSSTSSHLIESHSLRKEYGSTVAVNDVTFSLERGSVLALVGPNGAGKTTWLKMIAALLEPTAGTARIDGIDVREHPRSVHQLIGFLPDFFGLYDDLKVEEYFHFYGRAYGFSGQELAMQIERVLEQISLVDRRKEIISNLSRGMRQRVAIGRTLINNPPLLLLDEPAAGLDPEARHDLQELFKILSASGKTIIVSSHILTELEEYSTHVAMFQRGTLMAAGRVSEVRDAIAGTRRLLIEVPKDSESLRNALQKMEGVEVISSSGTSVIAEVRGDNETLARILKNLIEAGIMVSRFTEAEGSIQDAYLSIMKGSSE